MFIVFSKNIRKGNAKELFLSTIIARVYSNFFFEVARMGNGKITCIKML